MKRNETNSQNLLKQKKAAILSHALERALQEDSTEATAKALKEIEAIDKLISFSNERHRREKLIALSIGFLCIFIVGILYAIPISNYKILVRVTTDAVAFRLENDWNWSPEIKLDNGKIRVDNAQAISAPGLTAQPLHSDIGSAWLAIDEGSASFDQLFVAANAKLEIERELLHWKLFINEASHAAEFQLSNKIQLKAGNMAEASTLQLNMNLIGPETIDVKSDGLGAIPTMYIFSGDKMPPSYNISIKGLAFSKEISPAPGEFLKKSGIISGEVLLPEVDQKQELRASDILNLDGISGRIIDLQFKDNIIVTFEGTVHDVAVGPTGYAKHLSPSWLTYLYHQESLAFFWSAIAFTWSVLWSVRKTIFS